MSGSPAATPREPTRARTVSQRHAIAPSQTKQPTRGLPTGGRAPRPPPPPVPLLLIGEISAPAHPGTHNAAAHVRQCGANPLAPGAS